MSAIRDSARDAAEAHAHGLRTSGLEDHAVMLMREIGALGNLPALQPDHGAEPMHLITSELSGNYFLTWDTSLPFDAALTSEIGALGNLPALQPDHGAEPMHLITSELSGNYFLTWDTSLPFDAALTSMRIEAPSRCT